MFSKPLGKIESYDTNEMTAQVVVVVVAERRTSQDIKPLMNNHSRILQMLLNK